MATNMTGGTKSEFFDASKTGKLPPEILHKEPKVVPTLELRIISNSVGFGLFAARDIAAGEYFLHEAPAMDALYCTHETSHEIALEWQAYCGARSVHGNALLLAYPKVALAAGLTPENPENVLHEINTGLPQNLEPAQLWAGAAFSQEQYADYLNTRGATKTNPSQHQRHLAVWTFFKEYSFQEESKEGIHAKQKNEPRSAYIYMVGGMANHRCSGSKKQDNTTGPNAEVFVGKSGGLSRFIKPKYLAFKARRDIAQGEEITINYGKNRTGFKCVCETCRRQKRCVVM